MGHKSNIIKRLFRKFLNLFDASLIDNRLAYGQNAVLRKMLGIPKWLALSIWQQHGWYEKDFIFPPDLKDAEQAGLMLVYSQEKCEEWKKCSKIPCYVGGLMLSRYRRFMKWEQHPDAKGTIFFASHSTSDARVFYSIEDVHHALQALPAKYHPISISLHWFDYHELHLNEEYEKLGYKVVTAGEATSQDFPERFYDMLCSCKYTCSNDIGTYILYAVEMGIPFFFIGDRVNCIMSPDNFNNLPEGEFSFEDRSSGKEIRRLFGNGPAEEITPEQQAWFEREAGIGHEISLEELRKIVMTPGRCVRKTFQTLIHHFYTGIKRISK